uniref:Murine leukemia virus integrase C-terminal domain-containing protein n=1 Tax=Mustela putorius furo TaxID=9669 RepID=M3YLF1_MUSPF
NRQHLYGQQALQSVLKRAHAGIRTAHTGTETEVEPHAYQPDLVWILRHQVGNLEPPWKGPFTVLLTNPTAIKVEGIRAWIHVGHVKRAEDKNYPQRWMPLPMGPIDRGLKLRLKKQ